MFCSECRKCRSCEKLLVGLKKQQEHECGYLECPSCHEYIEIANHQCFIQIPKTPQELAEERKEKKRKRKRKRRTEAEAEGNGDDDDDDSKVKIASAISWNSWIHKLRKTREM